MLKEKMYDLYCKNGVKNKEELKEFANEIEELEYTDEIEECQKILSELTLQYYRCSDDNNINFANDDKDNEFLMIDSYDFTKEVEELIGIDFNKFVEYALGDSDNWGFDDEYNSCSNCNRLIRTSPTSYFWTPDFYIGNGEILCEECCKSNIENIVEETYINEYTKAITMFEIGELEEIGFKLLDKEYENGEYGINDNPKNIMNELRKEFEEVIFVITSQSQFSTEFKAMIRVDEEDQDEEEE